MVPAESVHLYVHERGFYDPETDFIIVKSFLLSKLLKKAFKVLGIQLQVHDVDTDSLPYGKLL